MRKTGKADPLFIDANQLDHDLQTDVCIVGAGPAGIAVALRLDRAGIDCVLLTGGGESPDDEHQGLNAVRQVGIPTDDAAAGNVRALGGTTHVWGGWCLPMDSIDFEARPWIPNSGWPFRRADLDPFYEEAHQVCNIPSPDYDPYHHISDEQKRRHDVLFGPILKNAVILVKALRFGEHYRAQLQASRRITTCLYGIAVELESTTDAKSVRAVLCKTLAGRSFRVFARRVVLASGAVQTPRLLLCSRSTNPAGLGNDNDLVGRYFMQHPVYQHASLLTLNHHGLPRLGRGGKAPGVGIATALTEEVQRQHRLPNCHFLLSTFDNGDEFPAHPREALRQAWKYFGRVAGRSPQQGDISRLVNLLERGRATNLGTAMGTVLVRPEQVPMPESRLTLAEERDALGMPTLVMDWRLSDLDWQFVDRCLEWIGCGVGSEGIGRVWMRSAAARPTASRNLHGGYHYFGTTRMSDDPRHGVVDRDCKVHGVDNLYVASSSVFPTIGYANPTLTIVALSLRLAAHLSTSTAN